MTTIVAVKKNGMAAIASDSLTTFGDTRLGRQYKGEHDKIIEIGVVAGAEFDTATQGPVVLHTVKLARSRK